MWLNFRLLLLALGVAGFVGTYVASTLAARHLYSLLAGSAARAGSRHAGPACIRYHIAGVAFAMFAWGALNSAIPVCWSTWLSKGIKDEPESGGGLLVGAIQLSIMLGGAFGGFLLDHISVAATFIGGTALLVLATFTIGRGNRIRPVEAIVHSKPSISDWKTRKAQRASANRETDSAVHNQKGD